MKKDEILKKEISDEDLEKVSGGVVQGGKGSGQDWKGYTMGPGGCSVNYLYESCGSTVEPGSRCSFSNDSCYCWNGYSVVRPDGYYD